MSVRRDSSSEDEANSVSHRDNQSISMQHKAQSTARSGDVSSIAETSTIKSSSPTPSGQSVTATHTSYDTKSLTTSNSTSFSTGGAPSTITNQTGQQGAGSIPIIRPPILPNPGQQGIRPDTSSLNHHYATGAILPNGGQGGRPVNPNSNVEVVNHLTPDQALNELLGPNAFQDVMLNIDYGAIEAYNIGMKDPYTVPPTGQFSGNQTFGRENHGAGVGRFDVAKAIFNMVDTNRDGSISRSEFQKFTQGAGHSYGQQSYSNYENVEAGYQTGGAGYQTGGAGYQTGGAGYQTGGADYQTVGAGYQTGGASYQIGGGGGHQTSAASYQTSGDFQTTGVTYESKATFGDNFSFGQLFDGATPEIANILKQSGLKN